MISLTNVSKTFDGGLTWAVHQVTLTIQTGETLVFLGSSGSGKTTTMNMINRLIEPSSGEITLDGQNIQTLDPVKLRRKIGYAFQKIGLLPHLTVAENISIVLRLEGVSKTQQNLRAAELLEFVNLDPALYAHRYPHELSGGQQQRVGVARALANSPKCLLLDEPFGALDSINRDALQEEFLTLKKRLNLTVVFVTHDFLEALRVADRIAIFDRGALIQIGDKVDILKNPANAFVRELFSKPAKQFSLYTDHITDA